MKGSESFTYINEKNTISLLYVKMNKELKSWCSLRHLLQYTGLIRFLRFIYMYFSAIEGTNIAGFMFQEFSSN